MQSASLERPTSLFALVLNRFVIFYYRRFRCVCCFQERAVVCRRQLLGDEQPPPHASPSTDEPDAAPAAPPPPSNHVVALCKQLNTLRGVLTPILSPDEIQFIFGRVASAFSEQLADALEHLSSRSAAWEAACQNNALLVLNSFNDLPLDHSRAGSYLTRLETFYVKHYGRRA